MSDVGRLKTPEGDRDDPDFWYDTRQAAQYLGVSSGTMERWRRSGRGPAFCRTVPGTKNAPARYLKRDLDEYKRQTRVTSTSEETA